MRGENDQSCEVSGRSDEATATVIAALAVELTDLVDRLETDLRAERLTIGETAKQLRELRETAERLLGDAGREP